MEVTRAIVSVWQGQEKNRENIVTLIIIRNLQRSLLFFVCLLAVVGFCVCVCVCAFSPSKDLQNKKKRSDCSLEFQKQNKKCIISPKEAIRNVETEI